MLHKCDGAATVRRLRGELVGAREEIADLERRLAYAQGQIEDLRLKVDRSRMQAAAPRDEGDGG